MAKSIGSRNANLLRLVEERALSKKVEGKKVEEEHEEQQETVLPYLPKDCMLKILIRLPLQSLSSTKFVCKPWYNMITSDNFVDVHFRRSESVLIFQKPVVSRTPTSYQPEKSNTFSVEASLQPRPSYSSIFDNRVRRKFYIQFMEFKGGKIETERYNLCCLGKIRATCNGLILLDNDLKKGGLIVMNPVTRKLIALPAGTICRPHNESFGFALNEVTGDYKVVHLFRDELGYVSCETLNLGTRKWREVNGPAFGVFGWFGYRPVSAIGALHWVPQINHSDCIVSMEVNSEKFQTISLPKSCTTHDGIVEMGGFLCFVAHDYQELNIDIWILKGLCNEAWTKYHRIMRSVIDMVPHFCLRISGDMVFRRDEDGSFYAYDFTHKVMTKIEREKGWFPPSSSCLPHVNSLVSWEKASWEYNSMMARSIGSRNANLLRLVEERALSKKVEEEHKEHQETVVPYLPKDCISKILVRLPLQSLSSMRFACKPWYNIIASDNFVNAHFHCSESVLIFQKSVASCAMTSYQQDKPNLFSVEASLEPMPSTSSIFGKRILKKFYIQFMEFRGGKIKTEGYDLCCLGNIRATCNGLILLDNDLKTGGLIVMNPVTRKLMALPVGTICRPYEESFGFAINEVTGEYKVVHLFRDELGYVGCETLNLGTRMWREVNGPAFGIFGWFGYRPVSAIGALHWVPQIDHSDYIVSFEVNSEKFHTISLPKSCRTHDGIVEKGGFLCFVTHEELNLDIWILKGLHDEAWSMHHRITRGCIIDLVPHFCLRISGDMIFRRDEDGSFYAYDFIRELMTKIEREQGWFPPSSACLPHVNSLVSWEKGQNECD